MCTKVVSCHTTHVYNFALFHLAYGCVIVEVFRDRRQDVLLESSNLLTDVDAGRAEQKGPTEPLTLPSVSALAAGLPSLFFVHMKPLS